MDHNSFTNRVVAEWNRLGSHVASGNKTEIDSLREVTEIDLL